MSSSDAMARNGSPLMNAHGAVRRVKGTENHPGPLRASSSERLPASYDHLLLVRLRVHSEDVLGYLTHLSCFAHGLLHYAIQYEL